jgi:hypothetical protein
VDAMHHIARGEYSGQYNQDRSSGEFTPQNWNPQFERYFSLS